MSNRTIADAARAFALAAIAVNEADGSVLMAAISDRDMAFAMLLKALDLTDPFERDIKETPPL